MMRFSVVARCTQCDLRLFSRTNAPMAQIGDTVRELARFVPSWEEHAVRAGHVLQVATDWTSGPVAS